MPANNGLAVVNMFDSRYLGGLVMIRKDIY